LFAVPWHNKIVLGTTDTPVSKPSLEPVPKEEEINFIINHFNRYTTAKITRNDVLSVFAGLRPLVKQAEAASTALISREHTIVVPASGLITIIGGKWTTYRKMAEHALQKLRPFFPHMSGDWTSRSPPPGGDMHDASRPPFHHVGQHCL
jgi:glycerol-3-phosphate dehydrogenase